MKKGAKRMVIRHGHGPRRGCNAAEKAVETKERQEARRAVRDALAEDIPELFEVFGEV